MKLNKKGSVEMVYIWSFYLLLSIVILASFLYKTRSIADGRDFKQTLDARDIGMGIEASKLGSGSFEIKYDIDEKLNYKIDEEKVSVSYFNPVNYRHSRIKNIKFEVKDGKLFLIKNE